MPTIKIVADENIPLVHDFFGRFGDVRRVPGHRIHGATVADADVLLIRSVTRVDRSLLEQSSIRFIGSATIGTDHVDLTYLSERGIAFAHAPASNAESVVEYVIAAMTAIAARRPDVLRGKKVGIIGCGSIGGQLGDRLSALGCEILKNDPPLADELERTGGPHDYLPLETVLRHADVVSLHVPLIRKGPYRTAHLLDADRLDLIKPGAWLINTSRGEVVDGAALLPAIGRLGATVLDVWEGEPSPDRTLVDRTDLATPHIAGYSYDGKLAGTRILFEALCRYLDVDLEPMPSPEGEELFALCAPDPALPETDWLHEVVRQMYPIAEDDARMRDQRGRSWPEHFTLLRRDYPVRRAFSRYRLGLLRIPERYREAATVGLRLHPV